MSSHTYPYLMQQGLWGNNVALVQILGLCPLLAVSNNTINGLGLGLATLLVLVASNVVVSTIRHWVRPEIRIPVFVMIIASFVTAIELLINALFHDLHKVLGIFIPLIVTNCAILGRAEAFASKNSPAAAAIDGLAMGLGFAAVLITLGALREVVGNGTLFDQAHLMFGEAARSFTLQIFADYRGFLVATLPPGAFLALGLLIAAKNLIDNRHKAKQSSAATPTTDTAAVATPG
jgi:Na+-translocating ferredoxin:NAD+ oxidoreductase subunit E